MILLTASLNAAVTKNLKPLSFLSTLHASALYRGPILNHHIRHFSMESSTYYTKTHEYVRPISETCARIGITKIAAEQIGEVVYVDLRPSGTTVAPGEDIANLESVKAVSEVYSPVGGTIIRCNPGVVQNTDISLRLVTSDPEGEGWLVELQVQHPEDLTPDGNSLLMDREAYQVCCEKEEDDGKHQ